jgi:flavin reductase (DIM6/NTAB) family NADH-FMN oxidoreductase RutF
MSTPKVNLPVPAVAQDSDFQGIDTLALSSNAAYHTLNAIVVPRPIAFVTTLGEDGVVNAAPFSYFSGVTSDPPTISISITKRAGELKDTARNIRARGELVVNVCTVALAHAVSAAAGDFPPQQSEVELCGLSLLPGHKVETPRLANAPIHLECKLDRVVEVGRQPVDLVLAQVVYVHARRDLIGADGRIDVPGLDPLARLAGTQFAGLHGFFKLPRGLPEP